MTKTLVGTPDPDRHPRCRRCHRKITHPFARALGVGSCCIRRLPPSERGALIRAAWSGARNVAIGTVLDAVDDELDLDDLPHGLEDPTGQAAA